MRVTSERIRLTDDTVVNRQNLAQGVVGTKCLAAFTPTHDEISSFLNLVINLPHDVLRDCMMEIARIIQHERRSEEETGTIEFYIDGSMNIFLRLDDSDHAHAFYRVRPMANKTEGL